MKWWLLAVGLLSVGAMAEILEETSYLESDHPAIKFTPARTTHDRIAKLDRDLETGKVKLAYAADGKGYLPALLKALDLNVDSQVIVFSKTSIQTEFIGPRTPRAIYFNDDTMLAYVVNADYLEFMSLDPVLGVQPYTLEPARVAKPGFARRDDCLRCHLGNAPMGI